MPNFTVSTPIDTFMQSANKAEMLENTGAAAADARREFAGGVRFEDVSGANVILGSSTDFNLDGKVLSFSFDFVGATMRFGKGGSSGGWLAGISPVGSVFIMRQAGSSSDYYRISFDEIPEGSVVLTMDCTDIANPVVGLIVNGSVIGSTVTTAQTGVYGDSASTLTFGQYGNLGFYSSASLSKLTIFNTALTAAQALSLYELGAQGFLAENPELAWGGEVSTFSFDTLPNVGGNVTGTLNTVDQQEGTGCLSFTGVGLSSAFADNVHITDSLVGIPLNGNVLVKAKVKRVGGDSLSSLSCRQIGQSGDGVAPPYQVADTNWTDVEFRFKKTSISSTTIERVAYSGTSGVEWLIDAQEVIHLGALAHLPLTDDCRQLKDIGPNRYDAIASATGVTHMKQAERHSFRDDTATGTGSPYLVAAADILAANEVVTGVIVDGDYYSATGTQTDSYRRIQLVINGSHILVRRSNGTLVDTIATTSPASTTAFSITVLTSRY